MRLGTLYFKNLVAQFGGTHYALASYNAGESRVVRWMSERGELPQDEFIDDIPFPETQNYVKKILGTAEDYRRLYGDHAAFARRRRIAASRARRRSPPLPFGDRVPHGVCSSAVSLEVDRRVTEVPGSVNGATTRYRAHDLAAFATQLLERTGLASDRPRTVAEVLLEGDLLGHSTHGLDAAAAVSARAGRRAG